MAAITFLGTGGGRFVLLSQSRYTGGLYLDLEAKCVVDPGPGALIRALEFRIDPSTLDAVLVSHNHLDHYNDAELMIEAMTAGMKKRNGKLVTNNGALEYISDYHRGLVDVDVLKAGDATRVGALEVSALPTRNHSEGIGFRFLSRYGTITYSADTAYSEDLAGHYKGSDIMILNTIFPRSRKIKVHLNTDSAARLIAGARPRLAIITHFGRTMLSAGPETEAAMIERETGVRTIAAVDGMSVDPETLAVSYPDNTMDNGQSHLGDYRR